MNVFSNPIAQLNKTEPIEIDNKQNQVEYGDVFFTTSSETPDEVGMSSVWLENKGNIYLNSFCFGFRPFVKNDPYYMAYMLRANRFRKSMTLLAQGISRYNISKIGVMNIDIQLPNNQEQERIGKLFSEIDNLITLHQRKCTYIFYSWEQRKLGDECFELIAGGDIDKTRSVNNGKYPIYANALTNDGIIGYYNDLYRVKSPAVTITGRGEIGYAMARNTDFTPVVRLISLRSKHNNYFLANAINLLNVVSESTGVPQLTIPQVEKFDIYFPKNINEEIKLGRLFNEIDNLITLHQRKCDTLVNVKKSLLEKMFPKNSSNIPEIRFKGFTDVWEQRKFENIYNYERPDKYIVNSTEYLEFGPTPVLTANKAFILGYTTENNKYVNSKESIIFDDFTMDTKFVDFPYMVKSSAIKILTLKDEKKDNIRFNFELLSNHRFNMLGHARHYISVVQPEEVFTTNKQEQDKIGELFTNLDNLITLHQHKELKRRNDNNDNLRW